MSYSKYYMNSADIERLQLYPTIKEAKVVASRELPPGSSDMKLFLVFDIDTNEFKGVGIAYYKQVVLTKGGIR